MNQVEYENKIDNPRYEYGTNVNTDGRKSLSEPLNWETEEAFQIPEFTPERVVIMQKGIDLTTGDRNASYGSPHPNLKTLGEMIAAYLRGCGWEGPGVSATDASMIMVLAKMSRVAVNKNHADNYVDGATYFAIAGECASIDRSDGGVAVEVKQGGTIYPRRESVYKPKDER